MKPFLLFFQFLLLSLAAFSQQPVADPASLTPAIATQPSGVIPAVADTAHPLPNPGQVNVLPSQQPFQLVVVQDTMGEVQALVSRRMGGVRTKTFLMIRQVSIMSDGKAAEVGRLLWDTRRNERYDKPVWGMVEKRARKPKKAGK